MSRIVKCSELLCRQMGIHSERVINLQFGSIQIKKVKIKPSTLPNNSSHFVVPNELFQRLYLKDGIDYKLRWLNSDTIEIGPTIGFLLGDSPHSYSASFMQKFMDRFAIYQDIKGFICAFAEENIDWDRKIVHGLYFNPNGKNIEAQWEFGVFPIPNVIYRRYFHNDEEKIEKLKKITNSRIFNSYRFTKMDFHSILYSDPNLRRHLPHTAILSIEKNFLHSFLNSHPKAIIKPVDLSRGRGILYIQRLQGRNFLVIDHRPKQPVKMQLSGNKFFSYLKEEVKFPDKHIIQELIPIVKINSSPFDIRVVMQKEDQGKWVCNGMEARHAIPNSYVTNLAKGGHATSVQQALYLAFGFSPNQVAQKIEEVVELSKQICLKMDQTEHHFAEFGIDLGIDQNGKVWIIEANVYPSFKGIRQFHQEQYESIRFTPLRYAYAISGFN
ncbi:YheC/YheD family protein [Ammoniphilus resinae]|uniref:Glutathione synthase/RimK-type ligase-like ATP-grasp enzyme n=1 Tax=Ammoniphilus resinae TaxID=861532 RepID=A0ABS4GSZ3_9BACL|nr:YheC/YheD family protein [Ammoniphilus resinae]MBP1933383.1 glutathione synthase/RimK-type ligase-like ATP-grasp enzyme [Ammoniphilus resinae]